MYLKYQFGQRPSLNKSEIPSMILQSLLEPASNHRFSKGTEHQELIAADSERAGIDQPM